MTNDLIHTGDSRYALILEAHPDLEVIEAQAIRLELGNMRFPLKAAGLYRLADTLKGMLAPFVQCRSGCNYCCYMPAMAFQHEAEAIATATGQPARKLGFRPMPVALAAAQAFKGLPCPFLVAGLCSIYAHRPLICRLHHSLNDDPRDCQLTPEGTTKPVANVNPDMIEMPYLRAVLRWNPREPYGAMQEFFPPELGHYARTRGGGGKRHDWGD
jgi:Fe-S-cluster containining protein